MPVSRSRRISVSSRWFSEQCVPLTRLYAHITDHGSDSFLQHVLGSLADALFVLRPGDGVPVVRNANRALLALLDVDEAKINMLNEGGIPIYEPGLDELVKKSRGRNLFFSTEIEKGIEDSEIIFVSVNTPTKTFGHGAGMAAAKIGEIRMPRKG